jgi:hypothetical protein
MSQRKHPVYQYFREITVGLKVIAYRCVANRQSCSTEIAFQGGPTNLVNSRSHGISSIDTRARRYICKNRNRFGIVQNRRRGIEESILSENRKIRNPALEVP